MYKYDPPRRKGKNDFYIISLKHSDGGYLTFWRANDAGYTTDLSQAGIYSEARIKTNVAYYKNDDNLPVLVDELPILFRSIVHVEKNHTGIEYLKNRDLIVLGLQKAFLGMACTLEEFAENIRKTFGSNF